jgi:amino acid transporter
MGGAFLIIAIATAVSVLTSISLAAIATNIDVKGGGDYYMISRTLGLEFGGAIGLVLFLAQSVSVAFYAIGFGEATAAIAGIENDLMPRIIAVGAVGGLFYLAWLGADVASKFQFVVMGLLVAALASFYLGAVPGFEASQASNNFTPPPGVLSFWAVFAIFFPAVTGFTQGVSLSGDLKDPGRSLPLGTFAAVGLSTIVYLSVAVLFAGNASARVLIDDTGAMGSIAAFGPLIDAGVIAATLSSAMASFLGAPRILQSLATDRIFPSLVFFAKGEGPSSNPRRGVMLSLAIALVTIALGDLNVIAPVVSMFFLISYGLLNYATYYEARAQSPSFRPRFRFFNKRLSLFGGIGCLAVMVAINPVAGLGSALIMYAVYRYLHMRERPERWADAARSHYFQRAKESIAAMTGEVEHARSWRPQIIAFSADAARRGRLLRIASWLEGDSGLTAAVEIVVGTGALKRKERWEAQRALEAQIDDLALEVYGRAVLALDAGEAVPLVVQSFGLGALRANTVMFGWPEELSPERLDGFFHAVREVVRLDVNCVIVNSGRQAWEGLERAADQDRRIDVWYEGDDDGSRLALLGAYLFTRTERWSEVPIRVIGHAPEAGAAETEDHLRTMLEEVRIPADVLGLANVDTDRIVAESAGASVVFLPIRLHRMDPLGPFAADLGQLVDALPMSVSLLAGQTIDLAAAPESGTVGALASAEEQLQRAEERLRTLEDELAYARSDLIPLERVARETHSEQDWARRDEGEEKIEDLRRRVLSARARVQQAQGEVEAARATGNNGTGGSGRPTTTG